VFVVTEHRVAEEGWDFLLNNCCRFQDTDILALAFCQSCVCHAFIFNDLHLKKKEYTLQYGHSYIQ